MSGAGITPTQPLAAVAGEHVERAGGFLDQPLHLHRRPLALEQPDVRMDAVQLDQRGVGERDVQVHRVVLDRHRHPGLPGDRAEEADVLLLRQALDRRGLQDDPRRAQVLARADEVGLRAGRGLRDRDRQGHAAGDRLRDRLHDLQPLGGVELVHLGDQAEDGDPVHALRDAGLDLDAHGRAVEPAVRAEEGVEDRIDAGEPGRGPDARRGAPVQRRSPQAVPINGTHFVYVEL
jgi:hypothetical protein